MTIALAPEERAYLCGLFDGEGCVHAGIAKDNTARVSVSVTMLDPEPVVLFHKIFGGSYVVHQGSSSRPAHMWQLANAAAIPALEVIVSGCLVKSRAARPALELARRMAAGARGVTVSSEEKSLRLDLVRQVRAVVNRKAIDEGAAARYLKENRRSSKPVISSDGVVFASQVEAAKALGVTSTAISYAVAKGTKCRGRYWSFTHAN